MFLRDVLEMVQKRLEPERPLRTAFMMLYFYIPDMVFRFVHVLSSMPFRTGQAPAERHGLWSEVVFHADGNEIRVSGHLPVDVSAVGMRLVDA
jgi:hypothetical protein